jgi:hypothetical protein
MKWTKRRLEKYLENTENSKIVICYTHSNADRRKYPESEGYKIINYVYYGPMGGTKPQLLNSAVFEALQGFEQLRLLSRIGAWLNYFDVTYKIRLDKFRRETSDLVS